MAKYTLTDARKQKALDYINKFRDANYTGKAARPVTRLRKVEPGKSVVATTINFADPESVDLDNAPAYVKALDDAHSRGDVPELTA